MFNTRGELIGVASYILSESGGFQGLGFAATVNICKKLLLEEKNPWYGLEATYISGKLAKVLNVPQAGGLLVQKVVLLSPAGRLGLQGGNVPVQIEGEEVLLGGDIVLALNGLTLDSSENIEKYMINQSEYRYDTFKLTVLRGGKILELEGKID